MMTLYRDKRTMKVYKIVEGASEGLVWLQSRRDEKITVTDRQFDRYFEEFEMPKDHDPDDNCFCSMCAPEFHKLTSRTYVDGSTVHVTESFVTVERADGSSISAHRKESVPCPAEGCEGGYVTTTTGMRGEGAVTLPCNACNGTGRKMILKYVCDQG